VAEPARQRGTSGLCDRRLRCDSNWCQVGDTLTVARAPNVRCDERALRMTCRTRAASVLLACLVATVASGCYGVVLTSPSPSFAHVAGHFAMTGSMSAGREVATATLLSDGRVLVMGGDGDSRFLSSAEIYDPRTGKFTPTGAMTAPRGVHTATLLNDGRVLVIGGRDGSADIYDPATGVFSRTGALTTPRQLHTATLLDNGFVLVAGGDTDSGVLASAELYDPAEGTFSPTGSMSAPRSPSSATLLRDGRVLVVGGENRLGVLASAELYDPATGTFSPTGSMMTARDRPSATLLLDGRVLVAGGNRTSAELYDPTTGTFARTGSMAVYPDTGSVTVLADGRVLFVGGTTPPTSPLLGNPTTFAAAEIYDPKSGTFAITDPLSSPRELATATLLRDGRVLIVGGDAPPSAVLDSAELFQP
jgi:WD40 repeat protein